MPLATTTTVLASTAATLLLAQRPERRAASITNNVAGTLYALVGSTLASTNAFTVQITSGSHYETHDRYQGEAISGVWTAASTTAGAQITAYL